VRGETERGSWYAHARISSLGYTGAIEVEHLIDPLDWDALGMRASGSHSVSFEDVRLPGSALGGGFPAGRAEDYMVRNLAAGAFHAASSAGIAEAAHAVAIDGLVRRV